MNSVIYCRVSTDDQEKEGTSLQTQLEACLKYCQDKGYTVLRHFSETYTGTTLDRPQLAALRDVIAAGEVDVVVIYCLDRLSRDPGHGAILTQEFERLNARLEAATEIIENTATGKLISYIRGYASQMEVDKIRERTARGKAARLKQGHLPTGTGRGAYGYDWDKSTKKRVIIDSEAAVVRRTFSMVLSGNSLSQIANTLNTECVRSKGGSAWCNVTVRRMVTNPIYCGDTYYGRRKRINKGKAQPQDKDKWILLPDVTPPIIDRPTFEAAQQAINQKYPSVRKSESAYFLTGHIFCGDCNSPICGATLRDRYRYYRCRGTTASSTRGRICNAPYIKADEIESYVWERLVNLTQSGSAILFTLLNKYYDSSASKPADLIPAIDRQIKALHTKLRSYAPQEQMLLELYTQRNVSKHLLLAQIEKLKEREAEDKRQIDQLLQTRKEAGIATKITLKLSEYSERLKADLPQNVTPEGKRKYLDIYQVRVEAARGEYGFACYGDSILLSDDPTFDEELDRAFVEGLKDAERQYPDMTLLDMIDFSKQLPGDHPFTKMLNDLKKRMNAQRRPGKNEPSTKYISRHAKQTSGGMYG